MGGLDNDSLGEKAMTRHDTAGIVPPIITPVDAEGNVSERLHRAEVRQMLSAEVHGLAVCGSSGEAHTATTDETLRITASTTEDVEGQIPVTTGIISNSTLAVIEGGEQRPISRWRPCRWLHALSVPSGRRRDVAAFQSV